MEGEGNVYGGKFMQSLQARKVPRGGKGDLPGPQVDSFRERNRLQASLTFLKLCRGSPSPIKTILGFGIFRDFLSSIIHW